MGGWGGEEGVWMQLFLGVAMPFHSKKEPLVYELNRATILEARTQGHLEALREDDPLIQSDQ